MRSRLECEVGNLGQAEIFLERLLEVMDLTPPGPSLAYVATAVLIPDVARITGVVDRLDVAASAASTVLSSPSALPGALSSARAGLAMVAVLRGDASAAAEHYRVLEL